MSTSADRDPPDDASLSRYFQQHPAALVMLDARPDYGVVVNAAEARLAAGDAAGALALIERHARPASLDGPHFRVRCVAVRALAALGRLDEAVTTFARGVPEDQGNTSPVHHARAAIAWAQGDRAAAQRSMCAGAFVAREDEDELRLLQRDPAWVTVAADYQADDETPIRPHGLAAEATWDPGDKEWVVGDVDGAGHKVGTYRYYRADGTICCENQWVDGECTGPWKRFHEDGTESGFGQLLGGQVHGTRVWLACNGTTSEMMHIGGVSLAVARSEMDYERGTVVAIRHYDATGQHVRPDGTPFPKRPAGIPERADYNPEHDRWVMGETKLADSGKHKGAARTGTWRWWYADGARAKECDYADNELHGPYREWAADGTVIVEARYQAGAVVEATYHRHDGATPEGFPSCAGAVVRAVRTGPAQLLRLFDAEGHEVNRAGVPLDALIRRHLRLTDFFAELGRIDWASSPDRHGPSGPVASLLRDLLIEDEVDVDGDALAPQVQGELASRLLHRGNVYPASALALAPLLRLAAADEAPNRLGLCGFVRGLVMLDRSTLEADPANVDPDVLAVNRAYEAAWPALLTPLLDAADPVVRARAAAIVSYQYRQAAEVAAALVQRLLREPEAEVRVAILAALGNLGDAAGVRAAEQRIGRDGFEGLCAAVAAATGRGTATPEPVRQRLRHGLLAATSLAAQWKDSPALPEHPVKWIGQALMASGLDLDEGVHLASWFGAIDRDDQLGLVAGALWMASPAEGQSDAQLVAVLGKIAADDRLWKLPSLSATLESFDLPSERDDLRAAVAARLAGGGDEDEDEDEDADAEDEDEDQDDDEGEGEEGADEVAAAAGDDTSAHQVVDHEDDEDEDDEDEEDDDDEDEDEGDEDDEDDEDQN
ncbi:MAG: HEAT repeat domain-containing protein [Kofleriaceae bacterium]|nr:HEAT repeat domain-containing protein [Kofleriaceae bacterium]